MNGKVKKYPDHIERKGFSLKKAQDEFIIQLDPRIEESGIRNFFDRKKEFVEMNFIGTDKKSNMITKFNASSGYRRWVARAEGRKETIDELMGSLEDEDYVTIAAPIYFREDLKFPNGFTFTDEIIVKLKDKTRKEDLQNVFQDLGVEEVKGRRGELGTRFVRLTVLNAKLQNTHEVARKLAKSEFVDWADVNWIQLHSGLCSQPNDTWFDSQWNLHNKEQQMPDGGCGTTGCDINVLPVWNAMGVVGSPLVVIAIIDTGCDLTHPDLTDNYVQSTRWYNAMTGTNTPDDEFGHGTCIAGIVAASGNNCQGVAGVCWRCRIMPIKISKDGPQQDPGTIMNALETARTNHANIINISFSFDLPDYQGVIDKLKECYDDGMVLVAAAGNTLNPNDMGVLFPATDMHVIAVGATDENDERLFYSRTGNELSVVAPGQHLWTTDIQGLGSGRNSLYGGGDAVGDYYEDANGTSGAAPHVAGLAGLLLSYNPTLTPAQIRQIIQKTAHKPTGSPLWDPKLGYGRIDAYAAMQEVVTNYPFSPVDVYIRDALTDSGAGRYDGDPLCFSPDIIVRKNAVFNPQTAFADMSIDPGSDKVAIGNDNYIYVRVHNKGNINSDIHARVYYAPLTTTSSPGQWKYIGQVDFYDVPAGGHAVSGALLWAKVPDPGIVEHFCIIASIEGFGDPHPNPAGVNTSLQYMDFIRNHNNISYRNVVFEDVMADTLIPMNFVVGGFAEARNLDLRIERKELAIRARISLKLPNYVSADTRVSLGNVVERPKVRSERMRTFELKGGAERSTIRMMPMPPGVRDVAKLEVRIPGDARPGEICQITVQQLFKDKVVGDFSVIGKVIAPKEAKFIAVRDSRSVHKADCTGLAKTNRDLWAPFGSLEDAREAGQKQNALQSDETECYSSSCSP